MSKEFKYSFTSAEKFYKAIDPNLTTSNKGVIYFNADQEDNAFPSKLLDLVVNGSSVHSNFISLKRNMIYAQGLSPVTPSPEWTFFAEKINKAGDNLNDVFHKMALDFAIFEAAAVQVIYDSEGEIAAVYHTDVSKIRAEQPDEFGRINNWYISDSWPQITNKKDSRNTVTNKATKIPAFNPSTGIEDGFQLLYIKRYIAGSQAYAIPTYTSSLNWIQLDYYLSLFQLNKVSTGYFPTGILFLNGDPDDEQKTKFKNDYNRRFLGPNGEKLMFVWGTDANERPEFLRLEASKDDTLFNELLPISAQKIATAHGGNLALAGIESSGVDLGGDANKLATSLAWYQKTTIRPMQEILIMGLNKIMDVNGLSKVDIEYVPLDKEMSSEASNTPQTEDSNDAALAVTTDKNLIKKLV